MVGADEHDRRVDRARGDGDRAGADGQLVTAACLRLDASCLYLLDQDPLDGSVDDAIDRWFDDARASVVLANK